MPKPSDEARGKTVEEILGTFETRESSFPRSLPGDLTSLVDHLHERLFDPELSVKSLRRWCQLGDHNVSSRFRIFTGRTLKSYIEAQRLEAAKQLLRGTQLPIVDIAFAVGYRHVQTFYGVFGRYFGCTPAHYRENGSSKGTG